MLYETNLSPSNSGTSRKDRTRDALVASGISLFSRHGYEATSTRQIENHAKVQRNLMTYHFGSKENFWKVCMQTLNQRMADRIAPAIARSKDIETRERIAYLVEQFVYASASEPEISRIMFDEGRNPSWRLKWLVRNYAQGFYDAIGQLFEAGRANKVIADIPRANFYYMLVGSAAMFSMAAECEILTGKNALDTDMVRTHAAAVAKMIVRAD